ncbi:hypothetical protein BESB_054160 [Besnoitia besnoiti]|uniref:Uncharacterized protein n=1 Tax=Besnoitia besnoiti TaxID=94643 RepID=A0A2A9MCP8_BESBE|nr:hypothetical protein BESB_054160 [Besnoitia besnoiti]PFH35765.1 hypothetical protein BESB_054160 [Besnoitia besnoiti]
MNMDESGCPSFRKDSPSKMAHGDDSFGVPRRPPPAGGPYGDAAPYPLEKAYPAQEAETLFPSYPLKEPAFHCEPSERARWEPPAAYTSALPDNPYNQQGRNYFDGDVRDYPTEGERGRQQDSPELFQEPGRASCYGGQQEPRTPEFYGPPTTSLSHEQPGAHLSGEGNYGAFRSREPSSMAVPIASTHTTLLDHCRTNGGRGRVSIPHDDVRQRALQGHRTADLLKTPCDHDFFHRRRLPPSVAACMQPAGKEVDWSERSMFRKSIPSVIFSSEQVADRLRQTPPSQRLKEEERMRTAEQGNRSNRSERVQCLLQQSAMPDGTISKLPLFTAQVKDCSYDSSLLLNGGRHYKKLFPARSAIDGVSPLLQSTAQEETGPGLTSKSRAAHSQDSSQLRSILTQEIPPANGELKGQRPCFRSSSLVAAKNPQRWGVNVFAYDLPPPRRQFQASLRDHLDSNLVPDHSSDDITHCKTIQASVLRPSLDMSTLTPLKDVPQKGVAMRGREADSVHLDACLIPVLADEVQGRRAPGTLRQDESSLRSDFVPVKEATYRHKRHILAAHDHLQVDMVPDTEERHRRQRPAPAFCRAPSIPLGMTWA